MSEKQFWKHLRENLPFKTYRVENKVMIGMPDVHYINKGNSGWIELKYMPEWKSKRVSTGYQLHQALWAKEHIKHGGTNWIMVRVNREFIGFPVTICSCLCPFYLFYKTYTYLKNLSL